MSHTAEEPDELAPLSQYRIDLEIPNDWVKSQKVAFIRSELEACIECTVVNAFNPQGLSLVSEKDGWHYIDEAKVAELCDRLVGRAPEIAGHVPNNKLASTESRTTVWTELNGLAPCENGSLQTTVYMYVCNTHLYSDADGHKNREVVTIQTGPPTDGKPWLKPLYP